MVLPPFVNLYVFLHDTSKTDAAEITKLDINISLLSETHLWCGEDHESHVDCQRECLHSCDCWFRLIRVQLSMPQCMAVTGQ